MRPVNHRTDKISDKSIFRLRLLNKLKIDKTWKILFLTRPHKLNSRQTIK